MMQMDGYLSFYSNDLVLDHFIHILAYILSVDSRNISLRAIRQSV